MTELGTPAPIEGLRELAGGTPLVQLRRCLPSLPGVELYAKLEWLAPVERETGGDLAQELLEQTCGRLSHLVMPAPALPAWRMALEQLTGVHPIEAVVAPAEPGPIGRSQDGETIESLRIDSAEADGWARRLAREEGLLTGRLGGAAMAAAVPMALRLAGQGSPGWIVVLMPDRLQPPRTLAAQGTLRPPPW